MPITTSYNVQATLYDTDGSTALANTSVYATNLSTGQRLSGNNIPLTGSNGIANFNVANIGPYNNGDIIEIYSYRAGKRARTTHTVNTTIGDGTVTLTMGVSVSYCTAEDVALFLGVRSFTESSKPSFITVENHILAAEDEIDFRTRHAWRTRYSNTPSGGSTASNYEWYDIPSGNYNSDTGRRIKLQHRFVKALASGDALEIWDGSSYVDWRTSKTEGRANDFWIEYENGVLFLRSQHNPKERAIRFKYRYGETRVPEDVKRAAIKLAAIQLLMSEDRSVLFPDGARNIPSESKIAEWQRDADSIVSRHTELVWA